MLLHGAFVSNAKCNKKCSTPWTNTNIHNSVIQKKVNGNTEMSARIKTICYDVLICYTDLRGQFFYSSLHRFLAHFMLFQVTQNGVEMMDFLFVAVLFKQHQ